MYVRIHDGKLDLELEKHVPPKFIEGYMGSLYTWSHFNNNNQGFPSLIVPPRIASVTLSQ